MKMAVSMSFVGKYIAWMGIRNNHPPPAIGFDCHNGIVPYSTPTRNRIIASSKTKNLVFDGRLVTI